MDDHNRDDETTAHTWQNQPIELSPEIKGEYFALRNLPDQRIIGIKRLIYHWTLHVDIDETGYRERYCYETLGGAIEGFLNWHGNGDPPGPWHRHPESGRRRDPVTGEVWREWEQRPRADAQ